MSASSARTHGVRSPRASAAESSFLDKSYTPSNVDFAVFQQVVTRLNQLRAEKDKLEKERIESEALVKKLKEKCRTHELAKHVTELRHRNDLKLASEKSRALLENYFSETQINFMLSNNSRVAKWTDEDISSALTLKCISSKAYKHIRNVWKLPLPSVSTLDRWVRNVKCEPGLMRPVLRLMKIKSSSMPSEDKLCSLSFDEMSIVTKHVYDRGADRIYPRHAKVQVVMLQGIIHKWRQPIFFNYDCPLPPSLLFSIIKAVEDSGFFVSSMVCDLAGGNQGLLSKLGISTEKNSFENPADSTRNIHVFADPPHLLKLIRNNVLDHGMMTPDGRVDKNPFKELISSQTGDMKMTHKLSFVNLEVKGTERQNVKTAAHLLSNSVGKALLYMGQKGKLTSNNWLTTAEFTLLIDKWFDVMNSSIPKDFKYPLKSSFDGSTNQIKLLERVITLMKQSRVIGRKHLLAFQKGVILSSMSLISLHSELKEKFQIEYLLTERLNQDVLENFFGFIRSLGGRGYDHPCPVSFKNRMKAYILAKKTVLLSTNPNTIYKDAKGLATSVSAFQANSSPVKELPPVESVEVDEPAMVSSICSEDEPPILSSPDEELPQFSISDMEADGMEYFLGYVVHKFVHKYPFLKSTSVTESGWVAFVSNGGLKHMSKEYETHFVNLEKIFEAHHGNSLKAEKGAVYQLVVESQENLLPSEVKEFFFRCQIIFRARHLNKMVKNSERKKQQKMDKIVK